MCHFLSAEGRKEVVDWTNESSFSSQTTLSAAPLFGDRFVLNNFHSELNFKFIITNIQYSSQSHFLRVRHVLATRQINYQKCVPNRI